MTALWARTPLRVRLVAALLALVTAALALAGFAAATSLRSYLMKRVDQQVAGVARDYRFPGGPDGPGRPGGPDGGRPPGDPGIGRQYFIRAVDPSGVSVETGLGDPRPKLPDVPTALRHEGRPFTVGTSGGRGTWRVVVVPRRDGGVVYVARSLADENGTVTRLVLLEAVIGATVLVLLGGIGSVVVRRSLRPLEEVETTAAAIAAGDLSRRVPESDERTEVGRLATAFNSMLHQIESAFRVREASEAAARGSEERMRRFVTDASHELRTPLTSIRGFAELYRQGAATGSDDVARLMRRIEDEGARMGLLVDDLLLLARLDRERPLARDRVELLPLAADAVHDGHAVDPGRPLTLDVAEECAVYGDEPRLRQVLANLVGNALRHTPAGTPVHVRVTTRDDDAIVEVADEGPGLDPQDAERVFERFYRADPSRTRAEGGTGLGLAIVSAIVAAHGGRAEVDSTPGEGATFRVVLPLAR